MKRLFCILLCLLLISTFCSCANNSTRPEATPDTDSMESIDDINETSTTTTVPEQTEAPQEEYKPSEEIRRAVKLGIVPEDIQDDYKSNINELQFSQLFSKVISLYDESLTEKWEKATINASDKQMLRDYAAICILHVSELMDIARENGDGYAFSLLDWDVVWDQLSYDYPMFPDYDSPCSFETSDDSEVCYSDILPVFILGRYSNINHRPLFDVSEDKSLRFNEYMTIEEAIIAAVRLYDSTIDVLVPLDQAINNCISDEAINRANEMPKVSLDKLPNWYGTMVHLDTLSVTENTPLFERSFFERIADMGFNYIRLGYNHYEIFEAEDEYSADISILSNLDSVIEWCIELGIHVNLDMHTLPGFSSGWGDDRLDILENSEHYKQAVDIWGMFAQRYANIPSSVLSYNLINEPNHYFTEESYFKLANDLIAKIREFDKEKIIISDGMLKGLWDSAAPSVPNKLLPNDIVQSIHLYPWHSGAKSGYINLLNWPYQKADPVNNLVSEQNAMVIKGSIKANTVLDLYVNCVYTANINSALALIVNGEEVDSFEFNDIQVDKDNCDSITDDNGLTEMRFGSYGRNNGLSISLTVPEDADSIKLIAKNRGSNDTRISITEMLIKIPTQEENLYAIPKNDDIGGAGFVYETDKYSAYYIRCCDTWRDVATEITLGECPNYTSSPELEDVDVFDMETLEAYFETWSSWSRETNTPIIINEFGVPFGLPEQQRVEYLRSVLNLLEKYDIPWSVYTGNYGVWGPLIHEDSTHSILPPDNSYVKDGKYYVDKPMLDLLKEFME